MVWKKAFSLLLLCPFVSYAVEEVEESAVKRIHNHLFIQDPSSAIAESEKFLRIYPESYNLQLAYLRALCQKGEEMQAFEQFTTLFNLEQIDPMTHRSALEWLAWGVLNKGDESSLLLVRLYALLGAAFTKDAKAITILQKELQGSNAILRSLAVKLSAQYGDAPLRKELLRLLQEEKVWFVKLEVIQAIGALRMIEAKKILQEIIASSKTLAEEKVAAILALAGMYETLSLGELQHLVASERSGLRQLASELVCHLDFQEGVDSLTPLLVDASPNVRISVMKTLGLLNVKEIQGKPVFELCKSNIKHLDPEVSIMAGWLSTILGQKEGRDILQYWIEQDREDYKRIAAAALAHTGVQGVSLAYKKLQEESNVYVKANLAIGLIGLRKHVKQASGALASALEKGASELWMWEAGCNQFFQSLAPSLVRHREGIPQYPQVVDQLVKLDILSMLSVVRHPKALESVKNLLKMKGWGITASAASTLLQEGDEASLDLVRELLQDADEKVRVQAALILAFLGGDPSSVTILMEAYPKVDREMKMHILEALGHIGEASSIPFLIELLKEPFQGLRVVAASALIQCLYH